MENNSDFAWDPRKEYVNIRKHRINFITAAKAFGDPERKIAIDAKHSEREQRFFCGGKVKKRVMTVRFTYRAGKIRIFGAGYWRKGVEYYEEKNR